jgi:hypothetical protein
MIIMATATPDMPASTGFCCYCIGATNAFMIYKLRVPAFCTECLQPPTFNQEDIKKFY